MRLPRLINPLEAMTMMLTGRNVRAGRAKSLGLVDAVDAGAARARRGQRRGRRQAQDPRAAALLVDARSTARSAASSRPSACARETAKKAPIEHYPGAARADRPVGEARRRSQRRCRRPRSRRSRGCWSPTPRAIWCGCSSCARSSRAWPTASGPGKRVHVIGAGAMGGDIAAWCAWHGFTVTLADMKAEPLGSAIKRAAELYGKIGHKSTDDPRRARPADPRPARRGRAHRRPRHRGGAGDARAQAQGLCRDRAEDAARRHPRHQHVEHSAGGAARRACSGPIGSSACTSSIRSRACSWSRW